MLNVVKHLNTSTLTLCLQILHSVQDDSYNRMASQTVSEKTVLGQHGGKHYFSSNLPFSGRSADERPTMTRNVPGSARNSMFLS